MTVIDVKRVGWFRFTASALIPGSPVRAFGTPARTRRQARRNVQWLLDQITAHPDANQW